MMDAEARRIPTYDQLMWPTLVALREMGGSGSIREIDEEVTHLIKLPEALQALPHGNGRMTELSYRLTWSRTYLRAVEAISNSSRGVWAITEYGRALTQADMAAIPPRVRATYSPRPRRVSAEADPAEPYIAPAKPELPDQALSSTEFDEWRDWLLDALQAMTSAAFERLCQRLLRESGFVQVNVTGKSGDGGIDGIGVLQMNLLSFQVFFQCKRYKGRVGAPAVRDFRGAMVGRTDKGLLITTGYFTEDAKREATRDGAPCLT